MRCDGDNLIERPDCTKQCLAVSLFFLEERAMGLPRRVSILLVRVVILHACALVAGETWTIR